MGSAGEKLGNEAGKLGKTLGKMGREAEKLRIAMEKLGAATQKMGTMAFPMGNGTGKMGTGGGPFGTDSDALGTMLRNWGSCPENCAADGSRRVWGEKILRSGRLAFARWLSEKLLTDPRFHMESGQKFLRKVGGGQEGLLFFLLQFRNSGGICSVNWMFTSSTPRPSLSRPVRSRGGGSVPRLPPPGVHRRC